MPQLIEFPRTSGDQTPGAALIKVSRSTDVGSFADLKARLQELKLWDRENPLPVLRFLGVRGQYSGPTALMQKVAATTDDDAAQEVLAQRLWEVNPLLFAWVFRLLAERPTLRDEIYKFLGSSVFKGIVPSRPALDAWLALAIDLRLIRVVGIAITPLDRGKGFSDKIEHFEDAEFLAEDKPEPEPIVGSPAPAAEAGTAEAASPGAGSAPATPSQPPPVPRWVTPAEPLPTPRKRNQVVPISRFMRGELFSDEICDETARRINAWWSEVGRPSRAPKPEDFGFDAEAWVENADELLYRISVAAALLFRLDADANAFKALDTSGVLAELYQGTMPEDLPTTIDARTLMIASLVARRCSESPGLAGELDQKKSGAEVFAALDQALGRGLFKIELHWIIATLGKLGLVRHDDLGNFTAVPYRIVRDTLFRLGFLSTPYATETTALAAAARATRRAAGGAEPPEEVITAFAMAAGCAFDCAHRRACEYACRERLE
jgi:hypothetical protein